MNTLGLFRLKDVTTEKLVFKNIDEKEFIKRLSFITDQSTNIGIRTSRKKFHGLMGENKFRLKRIETLYDQELIKGQLKKRGTDLVVEIEIKRGIILTLLPTIAFIIPITMILSHLIKGELDYRYVPFLLAGVVIGIWMLDVVRTSELEKVKNIFYGLYKPNE